MIDLDSNELELLIRLVENRLNADYSFEYDKILVKLEAQKEAKDEKRFGGEMGCSCREGSGEKGIL